MNTIGSLKGSFIQINQDWDVLNQCIDHHYKGCEGMDNAVHDLTSCLLKMEHDGDGDGSGKSVMERAAKISVLQDCLSNAEGNLCYCDRGKGKVQVDTLEIEMADDKGFHPFCTSCYLL